MGDRVHHSLQLIDVGVGLHGVGTERLRDFFHPGVIGQCLLTNECIWGERLAKNGACEVEHLLAITLTAERG